jgi:hypothetical protein
MKGVIQIRQQVQAGLFEFNGHWTIEKNIL